jgi:septin 4
MDLEMMRRLHKKVNIVIVITKADTLTQSEVKRLKANILRDVEANGIQLYRFPECDSDEDEDFKRQDAEMKQSIPFAVVGSNTIFEVGGKKFRGRQYPWGVVDGKMIYFFDLCRSFQMFFPSISLSFHSTVENPLHSDFIKLRTMLISTHMQDLNDTTQDVHYENFRAQCIAQMAQNAKSGRVRSDSIKTPTGEIVVPVVTETDKLLLQKEEEIRRMQEMLTQMQEKLKQQVIDV